MIMKKLAILAPCILPVPASKGGAVEELITCIINQNEISQKFAIDLYTIADTSYEQTSYTFTRIIPISLDNYISITDRFLDKYYRTFGDEDCASKRSFDKKIVSEFMRNYKTEVYYAVIVENQMSLAIELLSSLDGRRDFPIYFHMHNDVDIYRAPKSIKMLAVGGVQFIAISDYIKNQILKYESKAVVHILYNGVDLRKYTMTTKTTDEYTRFLYAGRIISEKGVLELVEAFGKTLELLPRELSDKVSLDIIGFSDKQTCYERRVRKAAEPFGNLIHLSSRLSTTEMASKYNEYDVVVMPTINEEPFGLVALETIAKGIPLITTNSGALPEVVGDGAIIVDKCNDFITKLATSMSEMVFNPQRRAQLGKKGNEWARNTLEFNIDYYYDNLVRIVDEKTVPEKVSIIVPVYNVEAQLGRCVETLGDQSYPMLEIILVDDGSTDSSGILCDEFAMKDFRIKVIHQPNKGLSGARNSGLDIATGDYIFFVDSDDYLSLDAIEKLLTNLHHLNADVMACGFAYVYDGDEAEKPFTGSEAAVWSGRESIIQMMRTNNICTVAWNKLYKADLWKGVRFPEGRLHEDEATTYKVLYKSKIVAFIPECLYKYYQRSNSLMNAGLEGRYGDYILAIKERINYFNGENEDELVEQSLVTLLDYIKYVYRNTNGTKRIELAEEFKEIVKGFGVPTILGLKKKMALLLWNYCKY
ncbi:MAG: glycosyltransferase [Pseudobutyrivibrio sp.]|nr:glycosyltransferase [Pseudobutyrivibrio sp.]